MTVARTGNRTQEDMVNTLKLEIVTPDAVVYSEDVEMVTLQGVEGQMGIYPQHVRLMTQLVPGEMIVHKCRHRNGYGRSCREHRRSKGRRSASTRRCTASGKAILPGPRIRQRYFNSLTSAIVGEATPSQTIKDRSTISGLVVDQCVLASWGMRTRASAAAEFASSGFAQEGAIRTDTTSRSLRGPSTSYPRKGTSQVE